ncbi:M23 family metallopeptidase [Marinitenerispora sediminis]|uniref:M23 family peptidase n=1 Tax=Marinitenerispora sediminis TaxID=1931232 RepID=A0A368SY50_9ACTN|nr:M23 family metallopeptidase [Marinitenerispora sediminis]RCV48108.1 M23 family peptidase [Marinitenerispora sediminis]RCV48735.1 M23 family peptidase [Marinitenerispora sediminis]RCV49045.1 M23 family peptidase [Marinitenerispora sediminis]
MRIPRIRAAARSLGALVGSAALIAVLMPTGAAHAAAGTEAELAALNLRTPFDCGQVWNANTRTNHNPQNSVDFQRAAGDALNKNVRSSAPGTVTTVRNLGNESYGRYVVIDHGGGITTLYAHLNSFNVSVGQRVSTGTVIGRVGSSGGSTGPHLHYEQRSGGAPQRVVLNGVAIRYFGNTTITSSTGC